MRRLDSAAVFPFGFAAALVAVYGPALDPSRTFAGMDFLNMVLPEVAVARGSLSQGALPLWNWYSWGGCPLLATSLAALAYPPTWAALAMTALGLPLTYALQLDVFAHLLWAGLGVARLAGAAPPGAGPWPGAVRRRGLRRRRFRLRPP